MPPLSHLAWPFFSEAHRYFGPALAEWAGREVSQYIDHTNVDGSCRSLVRALGKAGWLKAVVPAKYGGLAEKLDVRTLCAAREILSWHLLDEFTVFKEHERRSAGESEGTPKNLLQHNVFMDCEDREQ